MSARRNKPTTEEVEGGLSPLSFLLSVMRDEQHPLQTRLDAARAAAPYCHARLHAVAKTPADQPVEVLIRHFYKPIDDESKEKTP